MIHLPKEMYVEERRDDGTICHICTLRQILCHTIGLTDKKPYHRAGKAYYKPYRNYFATYTGDPIWVPLEEAGLAAHQTNPSHPEQAYYSLTRAGLDWLGNELDIIIK